MWNVMLKALDNFCVSRHDLGYLSPFSLKSPKCPNTCKAHITQPSERLDVRVKANLMWNVELETLDYFSCVTSYDLGGGIRTLFPQITLMLEHLQDRYNWTLRWPWHNRETSFDVKWGAEVLGLLFVCSCAWFGVFGFGFPKLSQYSSTWETGITQSTETLDTRVRSHLM